MTLKKKMVGVFILSSIPAGKDSNYQIIQSIHSAFVDVTGKECIIAHPETLDLCLSLYDADIFLIAGSHALGVADLGRIKERSQQTGSPLVAWVFDDPYELDFRVRFSDLADYVFTNEESALEYYHENVVYHLPLAANRDLHYRPILDWSLRPTDIFFCGYAYQNRIEIIEHLSPVLLGINSVIVGDAWPVGLRAATNRRLNPEAIADYYAQSRFTLNIGRDLSLANEKYEVVASTPGPRTFEAAAAGATQILFLDSLAIDRFFKLGTEILGFDSLRDFRDLLEKQLVDGNEAFTIGCRSQERCMDEHTYHHRVREMLDILS